jgi:hypothetical protein
MVKPKKTTKRARPTESDDRVRDQAIAALQEQIKAEDNELLWARLSDDKSRIVVGTTHGKLAVFGVFAVTEAGELGAPEPFNLHYFKMTWRGEEEHPTPEETSADEAEHTAWMEKQG